MCRLYFYFMPFESGQITDTNTHVGLSDASEYDLVKEVLNIPIIGPYRIFLFFESTISQIGTLIEVFHGVS